MILDVKIRGALCHFDEGLFIAIVDGSQLTERNFSVSDKAQSAAVLKLDLDTCVISDAIDPRAFNNWHVEDRLFYSCGLVAIDTHVSGDVTQPHDARRRKCRNSQRQQKQCRKSQNPSAHIHKTPSV